MGKSLDGAMLQKPVSRCRMAGGVSDERLVARCRVERVVDEVRGRATFNCSLVDAWSRETPQAHLHMQHSYIVSMRSLKQCIKCSSEPFKSRIVAVSFPSGSRILFRLSRSSLSKYLRSTYISRTQQQSLTLTLREGAGEHSRFVAARGR